MTHYELLQVPPDASAEQIKQAFRQIIARYHPDKVQHLGAEFQELAQVRSAELTTAYKTLSDPARRAEYDQSLEAPPRPAATREPFEQAAGPVVPPPPAAPIVPDDDLPDLRFESLRSGRDSVLRRAALARVDHLLNQALTISEGPSVPGFDLSYLSKPRLFERGQGRPWLLAKFVARIDKRTVQRVRAEAARANAAKKAAVSVFLLAGEIVSEAEIAHIIGTPQQGHPVVIVPVDVRDWRALVPNGADQSIRDLAARLKTAS